MAKLFNPVTGLFDIAAVPQTAEAWRDYLPRDIDTLSTYDSFIDEGESPKDALLFTLLAEAARRSAAPQSRLSPS